MAATILVCDDDSAIRTVLRLTCRLSASNRSPGSLVPGW